MVLEVKNDVVLEVKNDVVLEVKNDVWYLRSRMMCGT